MSGKRVILYCRAANETSAGSALERQEKELRRYAASQGYCIVDVVRLQESGIKRNSQGRARLKSSIEKHRADLVLMTSICRISLNYIDCHTFCRTLAHEGVVVYALNENTIYPKKEECPLSALYTEWALNLKN